MSTENDDSAQLRLFRLAVSPTTEQPESPDTLTERARWVDALKENIDDVRTGRQTAARNDDATGVLLFSSMENLLADILEGMTGERYP